MNSTCLLRSLLFQHPLLCAYDYDAEVTDHVEDAAEVEDAGSVEDAEVIEDVENYEEAGEVEEASCVDEGLRSKQRPWGERSRSRTPPCRQSKVQYTRLQPTPPEEPPPSWLLSKDQYTRLQPTEPQEPPASWLQSKDQYTRLQPTGPQEPPQTPPITAKFWYKVKPDVLWNSMHGPSSAERPVPPSPANESGVTQNQSHSAEQPALKHDGSTACPNVAALLECVSSESLDWLVQNFLWGKVSEYTLSSDGTLAFNPGCGRISADTKLELFIKLTRERRELFCADPLYVLSEDELQIVLDAWKNDYKKWMHPEKLRLSYSYNPQQWHQVLRTSFRTFLFQLVGCYEMTIFFIVVPFNPDNLDLFQHCWNQSTTNADALKLSKRLARNPEEDFWDRHWPDLLKRQATAAPRGSKRKR